MPKRFARRRSSGGKRRVSRGRRRLTSSGAFFVPPSNGFYTPAGAATARPTRSPTRPGVTYRKKRRGRRKDNGTAAGPYPQRLRLARRGGTQSEGKNTVPAAIRGDRNQSGAVKRGIKRKIMDALVFGANPVLQSDLKLLPQTQPDWSSGTQSFTALQIGNSPGQLGQKYIKMKDASYYNTSVAIPSQTTDVNTQRMVVFPSTFFANMKNTCSHTIYVEIRVVKAKGYHNVAFTQGWGESLGNDNIVQFANSAPWGTEETVNSLYKRPDMRSAYLNCRYTEVKSARAKWVLEPGVETKYIFKMPGFTYDEARYNVLVGSSAPTRCPQTYEVLIFCHSELVTGAIDTDVAPGSGHLSFNYQLKESWQCLPTVKKYQNIAGYSWGAIDEADEQDVNTDDVQQETYFENA